MASKMLIDAAHPEETRVVVLRGNRVEEFDFETEAKKPLRGNIFLAKVTRVEPSLQAAFVDYGGNRHGFLAFSEIHPDYYQIPMADREILLAEQAAEARHQAEEDARLDDAAEAAQRAKGGYSESSQDEAGEEEAEEESEEEAEENFEEDETDAENAAHGESEEDADRAQTAELSDFRDDHSRDHGEHHDEDHDDHLDLHDDEQDHKHDEDDHQDDHDRDHETQGDEDHAHDEDHEYKTELLAAHHPLPAQISAEKEAESATQPGTSGVESVGAEDAFEEVPVRRTTRRRRVYKIQEVIKRRQIILVQVVKEERGNKGAALTTFLSLAGRYCVLMPNTARGGGISRKITNAVDRKRLKSAAQSLNVPDGMGLIIRTAGANRTKVEIKRDFEYLIRLWENIRELTLKSTAPAVIYEEGNLIKRSIRDLYTKDIDTVIVDGDEGYKQAKEFMRMLMPSHAKNVQRYKDRVPLLQRYQTQSQLDSLFTPQVQLKSGGYLVINPTEALVSIDVNSGRSTREHNIEDTALKTNLEAAEEVARQLRLRDLAGLIVIDFIDMDHMRNNRAVERRIKECLKTDRARIQVGRISPFGLLEMSRQRLRTSVLEGSSVPCPTCHGTGSIRSVESLALQILRNIEEEGLRGRARTITATMSTEVALYLLNQKRVSLSEIERHFGVEISIQADAHMPPAKFNIETSGARPERVSEPVVSLESGFVEEESEDDEVVTEEEEDEEEDEEILRTSDQQTHAPAGDDGEGERKRKRRRRRRGRRGGGHAHDNVQAQGMETHAEPRLEGSDEEYETQDKTSHAEDNQFHISHSDGQGENSPRRRRRRRRGGRGRNHRHDNANGNANGNAGTTASEHVSPAFHGETPAASDHASQSRETAPRFERTEAAQNAPMSFAPSPAADNTPQRDSTQSATEAPPAPRKRGWWQRRSE